MRSQLWDMTCHCLLKSLLFCFLFLIKSDLIFFPFKKQRQEPNKQNFWYGFVTTSSSVSTLNYMPVYVSRFNSLFLFYRNSSQVPSPAQRCYFKHGKQAQRLLCGNANKALFRCPSSWWCEIAAAAFLPPPSYDSMATFMYLKRGTPAQLHSETIQC